jgi:hypothetical protein
MDEEVRSQIPLHIKDLQILYEAAPNSLRSGNSAEENLKLSFRYRRLGVDPEVRKGSGSVSRRVVLVEAGNRGWRRWGGRVERLQQG